MQGEKRRSGCFEYIQTRIEKSRLGTGETAAAKRRRIVTKIPDEARRKEKGSGQMQGAHQMENTAEKRRRKQQAKVDGHGAEQPI